jgi:hypothetical protein
MPIRAFSRLALVFVVLFATLVAGTLFPLQPTDAAWQSRVIATLVNAATLPLMALALSHLCVLIDPKDPVLEKRHQFFCTIALVASLGFLLLLPLQISSSMSLQKNSGSDQRMRLEQAQTRLNDFRSAVQQANSPTDLRDRLQRLQGPSLSPAELALPLPLLKAQVSNVFDQAQNQIARDRSALPSTDPLRLLPQHLRAIAACLALSFGFGTFALRPGSEISVVDELLLRLQSSGAKRPRRARSVNQEEYIRQLHGEEEG